MHEIFPAENSAPRSLVTRDQIVTLEREIQRLPQVDCPVRHYFAQGMAAREMTIPAGVVLTGAVHRHEHLCTISKGCIAVSTDDGMRVLHAPYTFISKPGAKRVGYAIEETVWTTYHVTNETDPDRLVEEITESTSAEMLGGARNVQLQAQIARDDYRQFLAEYGLSQEAVTRLVESEADQMPMPAGVDTLAIASSPIAGVGMFAVRGIADGDVVAPVRLDGKRTPAGRYINHSPVPNVRFVPGDADDLFAIAMHDIRAGKEILVDYRQAMNVNGAGFHPIGAKR